MQAIEGSICCKRIRGRPRGNANQHVAERLVAATELLLRENSHLDLSERKIAAAANSSDSMIHYYFGDKDGLICETVIRYCDEIAVKLKALDGIDPKDRLVTRHIFGTLIDAYYTRPWIARIIVTEFVRSHSRIKELFLKRYGEHGQAISHIKQIFDRLVALKVYDSRINTTYAAMSMLSIVAAPIVMAPLSGFTGLEFDKLTKSDWIDHVADLFERQLNDSYRDEAPALRSLTDTNGI